MQSVIAKPLSRRAVRQIALELREIFDYTNTPYFPIVRFVELILPSIIPEFTFIVEPIETMGDCLGLTFPEENCMKIREDVYINAINGNGRDRFTIAHELGHYILHKSQNVSLARTVNKKIEPFRDPEWQANTFAAEFLIPQNLIAESDNVFDISKTFGVSHQAAEIRLKNISN